MEASKAASSASSSICALDLLAGADVGALGSLVETGAELSPINCSSSDSCSNSSNSAKRSSYRS